MSLNVLVLAEDITYDQHLVCPVVRQAFAALGQPRAKVRPCLDPRFGGYSQATESETLSDVYWRYSGAIDLFILAVDRDGEPGRADRLAQLEEEARDAGTSLIGVAAHQEIEAWALAGLPEFKPRNYGFASWPAVRRERDVKEAAFEPFALDQRAQFGVGGGRKRLGEAAARRYAGRIRVKCAEVATFEQRLSDWLASR